MPGCASLMVMGNGIPPNNMSKDASDAKPTCGSTLSKNKVETEFVNEVTG